MQVEERRSGRDRRRPRVSELTTAKLLVLFLVVGIVLAISVLVLVIRVNNATNQLSKLDQNSNTILLKIDKDHSTLDRDFQNLASWVKKTRGK
jgi:predicted PurR-regulated permease PerM